MFRRIVSVRGRRGIRREADLLPRILVATNFAKGGNMFVKGLFSRNHSTEEVHRILTHDL